MPSPAKQVSDDAGSGGAHADDRHRQKTAQKLVHECAASYLETAHQKAARGAPFFLSYPDTSALCCIRNYFTHPIDQPANQPTGESSAQEAKNQAANGQTPIDSERAAVVASAAQAAGITQGIDGAFASGVDLAARETDWRNVDDEMVFKMDAFGDSCHECMGSMASKTWTYDLKMKWFTNYYTHSELIQTWADHNHTRNVTITEELKLTDHLNNTMNFTDYRPYRTGQVHNGWNVTNVTYRSDDWVTLTKQKEEIQDAKNQ